MAEPGDSTSEDRRKQIHPDKSACHNIHATPTTRSKRRTASASTSGPASTACAIYVSSSTTSTIGNTTSHHVLPSTSLHQSPSTPRQLSPRPRLHAVDIGIQRHLPSGAHLWLPTSVVHRGAEEIGQQTPNRPKRRRPTDSGRSSYHPERAPTAAVQHPPY